MHKDITHIANPQSLTHDIRPIEEVVPAHADQELNSLLIRLNPDQAPLPSPENLELLLTQLEMLKETPHPHLSEIYEVYRYSKPTSYFREHSNGPTLDRLVADDTYNFELFLSLASQCLSAFEHLHSLGIIHRGLSPRFIVLREESLPDIVYKIQGLAETSMSLMMKLPHLVLDPQYMSLAQLEGKPPGRRDDLFSLGLIFYEVLAGKSAFAGTTEKEKLHSILHSEAIHLSNIRADLPDWICDWVMNFIQRHPEERHTSAYDASYALSQEISKVTRSTGPLSTPKPPFRPEALIDSGPAPTSLISNGIHTQRLTLSDSTPEGPKTRSLRAGYPSEGPKTMSLRAGFPSDGPKTIALRVESPAAPSTTILTGRKTMPLQVKQPVPTSSFHPQNNNLGGVPSRNLNIRPRKNATTAHQDDTEFNVLFISIFIVFLVVIFFSAAGG